MTSPVERAARRAAAEELLEALALRINFITVAQVARTWFADEKQPKTCARELLTRLVQAGLLSPRLLLNAFPEQSITAPVFVWEVGQRAPNYGALSKRLRDRWKGLAWTQTQGFVITQKGAELFQGGLVPELKMEDENHDLHMAAVFLFLRGTQPEWVKHWQSDRHYAQERGHPPDHGEKTPDAFIRIGDWKRVVDFGGAYHEKKVTSIHTFWSDAQIPYELW